MEKRKQQLSCLSSPPGHWLRRGKVQGVKLAKMQDGKKQNKILPHAKTKET